MDLPQGRRLLLSEGNFSVFSGRYQTKPRIPTILNSIYAGRSVFAGDTIAIRLIQKCGWDLHLPNLPVRTNTGSSLQYWVPYSNRFLVLDLLKTGRVASGGGVFTHCACWKFFEGRCKIWICSSSLSRIGLVSIGGTQLTTVFWTSTPLCTDYSLLFRVWPSLYSSDLVVSWQFWRI